MTNHTNISPGGEIERIVKNFLERQIELHTVEVQQVLTPILDELNTNYENFQDKEYESKQLYNQVCMHIGGIRYLTSENEFDDSQIATLQGVVSETKEQKDAIDLYVQYLLAMQQFTENTSENKNIYDLIAETKAILDIMDKKPLGAYYDENQSDENQSDDNQPADELQPQTIPGLSKEIPIKDIETLKEDLLLLEESLSECISLSSKQRKLIASFEKTLHIQQNISFTAKSLPDINIQLAELLQTVPDEYRNHHLSGHGSTTSEYLKKDLQAYAQITKNPTVARIQDPVVQTGSYHATNMFTYLLEHFSRTHDKDHIDLTEYMLSEQLEQNIKKLISKRTSLIELQQLRETTLAYRSKRKEDAEKSRLYAYTSPSILQQVVTSTKQHLIDHWKKLTITIVLLAILLRYFQTCRIGETTPYTSVPVEKIEFYQVGKMRGWTADAIVDADDMKIYMPHAYYGVGNRINNITDTFAKQTAACNDFLKDMALLKVSGVLEDGYELEPYLEAFEKYGKDIQADDRGAILAYWFNHRIKDDHPIGNDIEPSQSKRLRENEEESGPELYISVLGYDKKFDYFVDGKPVVVGGKKIKIEDVPLPSQIIYERDVY